ncbi:hypothetical protein DVS77_09640 [Mycolicibacterium moriokaense]|nr:hypothetical protein DVS77_09640 [Mycolicibacterium moriokaense]
METIANAIQGYHDEALKAFEDYESRENSADDPIAQMKVFSELQSSIHRQIKGLKEQFKQMMQEVGEPELLGRSWVGILRDWNTLDQYVRLQRLERDLQPLWFNRDLDEYLQQRLNLDTHPMSPFFAKHYGTATDTVGSLRVESMRQVLDSLSDFAKVPLDQFPTRKVLSTKYFPNQPFEGYIEAVRVAAANMRDMLITVQQIESDEWLAE